MNAAAERLHAHGLSALADPVAYEGGRNGIQAAEEAISGLQRWLDGPNDGANPWRCLPALLEALLTLHERDRSGYEAFLGAALLKPDPACLDLSRIQGLWHLNGVLSALSDDHGYALGGEGANVHLAFQEQLPQWRPGARPADVLAAVRTRLAALPQSPARRPPAP